MALFLEYSMVLRVLYISSYSFGVFCVNELKNIGI